MLKMSHDCEPLNTAIEGQWRDLVQKRCLWKVFVDLFWIFYGRELIWGLNRLDAAWTDIRRILNVRTEPTVHCLLPDNVTLRLLPFRTSSFHSDLNHFSWDLNWTAELKAATFSVVETFVSLLVIMTKTVIRKIYIYCHLCRSNRYNLYLTDNYTITWKSGNNKINTQIKKRLSITNINQ